MLADAAKYDASCSSSGTAKRNSVGGKGVGSTEGAGNTSRANAPRSAPGSKSTQMIVGADDTNDRIILSASAGLYSGFNMRRVYCSASSPIPDASKHLPLVQPPLMREHRLYQADWLIRFYGFAHDEIVPDDAGNASGMLSLDTDPKLAWALANRAQFPVNINTAAHAHTAKKVHALRAVAQSPARQNTGRRQLARTADATCQSRAAATRPVLKGTP